MPIPAIPPLDITKPTMTRRGDEAFIVATDMPGKKPLLGYYLDRRGRHPDNPAVVPCSWAIDGRADLHDIVPDPLDLVNRQERREVWLNIYSNNIATPYNAHATWRDADNKCNPSTIIARVRVLVEFTPGQFDTPDDQVTSAGKEG